MVAELRQAITQHTTVASVVPDSPTSELDWSPTSELNSESPVPTDDRDSTSHRQIFSQNANAAVSELPNESQLTPDRELGLISSEIASAVGELPYEPPTTWRDSDDSLVPPSESENAPTVSELLIELPAAPPDRESITEPLAIGNAPTVSELLSESLKSTLDSMEAALLPMAELADAQVPIELLREIPTSLTGTALAHRLGVSPGSISRNKHS